MKAVVKTKPEAGAEFLDVPMPKLQDDEMLVKVLATGICGSDRDVYEWQASKHDLPLPVIMGHEFFGEILELGRGVKGFKVGERISSDSHMPCGECYLCRTGKSHLCMKRGILGHQKDGCFAEYIALPAVAAVHMPEGIKPELGALMEPMGVVYHAATRTELSGKSVLVLGLGALGYIMADAARILGAGRVIVCSTKDDKIQQAIGYGADFGINSKTEDVRTKVLEYTNGHGVDVVFEMSGYVGLYNLGIDSLAYGGTMVVVGVPSVNVEISDYMNRVIFKEITIMTSFGRLFYQTWELMKELIDAGKLDPSRYVGEILSLSEFKQGLALSKNSIGRIILLP